MTRLKLSSISLFSFIALQGCSHSQPTPSPSLSVSFSDVSTKIGLITEDKWKYGGPAISDLNNDGHYDLLLTNHDTSPVQLYMANDDFSYSKQADLYKKADLHGISAGDYDLDGDNDVLLSLGGGNGTAPQPQRLLRNDNGKFVDVTVEAGISEMGARGRSVRWIDLDSDGDLDFMQVNAEKMVNEELPRNILFENKGDGTFTYHPSPDFEEIDAERLLITDFDGDNILDIVAFISYSTLTVWKGNNDFTFTNVTNTVLPKVEDDYSDVIAVAQADIDNDGDPDLYFARGKLHYTVANNSFEYNESLKRLDIRDEGNKSHDGLTVDADGPLTLSDFYNFPRAGRLDAMPVYLGENKTLIDTPTKAITVTQAQASGFPEKPTDTGWYLGYLGEGKWRIEWILVDHLAWDIRAVFSGVNGFTSDQAPMKDFTPDILLRNDGGRFTDISDVLPKETQQNNWGVTPGDFNNDGFIDLFVYRFGGLTQRVADVLLLNKGNNTFDTVTEHGATSEIGRNSHGDMGVAFDYNHDGKIDILSGDDDSGKWHMYRNNLLLDDKSHYLLAHIGYSEKGIDPLGAKITITTKTGQQYQLVGSSSATHSQSLLNITHFGLGKNGTVDKIDVVWRSGETASLNNVKANQLIKLGQKIK